MLYPDTDNYMPRRPANLTPGFRHAGGLADLAISRAWMHELFGALPAGIPGNWYPSAISLYFAADQHLIADRIAFPECEPVQWWPRRCCTDHILGSQWHAWLTTTGEPVRMFASLLRWFRDGYEGLYVLDVAEAGSADA